MAIETSACMEAINYILSKNFNYNAKDIVTAFTLINMKYAAPVQTRIYSQANSNAFKYAWNKNISTVEKSQGHVLSCILLEMTRPI